MPFGADDVARVLRGSPLPVTVEDVCLALGADRALPSVRDVLDGLWEEDEATKRVNGSLWMEGEGWERGYLYAPAARERTEEEPDSCARGCLRRTWAY